MWQLSSLAAAELAPVGDLYILSVGTEGQVKSEGETDWYGNDAEFVRQSLNTAAPMDQTTQTRTLTADLATETVRRLLKIFFISLFSLPVKH